MSADLLAGVGSGAQVQMPGDSFHVQRGLLPNDPSNGPLPSFAPRQRRYLPLVEASYSASQLCFGPSSLVPLLFRARSQSW